MPITQVAQIGGENLIESRLVFAVTDKGLQFVTKGFQGLLGLVVFDLGNAVVFQSVLLRV
ncbi:hypothetical protein D9M69_433170 [compost metagenome]